MNRLGTSLLLTILAVGLNACSSSSDPTPESAPDGAEQLADPTQNPPVVPVEGPVDTPIDGPVDAPSQGPVDAPTDGPVDAPSQGPVDVPTDGPVDAPSQGPVDVPTDGPVDAPSQEPVDAPTEEPGGTPPPETTVDILVPNLESGGDLDRLVRGVTRQASLTLLTLNQRLTSGEMLSPEAEQCLGTYDPAVGEQLLAIDCPQPIVVDGSSLRVHRASFYDTDACTASVSAGDTDDCQLESARIDVPVEWSSPTSGVPQPIYAGSQIFYAIDNELLRIDSLTDVNGASRCDIELLDSTQTSTPINGQSCGNIVQDTANRIDSLLPEQ